MWKWLVTGLGVAASLVLAVGCASSALSPGASPSPSSPQRSSPQSVPPSPTPGATTGNFDGAGPGEPVTVYQAADGTWWIAFRLHSGQAVRARLAGFFQGCHASYGVPPQIIYQPHVMGVADLTADGLDEALVQIDHGASTAFPAIFGIVNGSIRAATVMNGPRTCQRIFPVNGSVTHGNGFACSTVAGARGFQVLQADDNPPNYNTYDWYRSNYQWVGLNLRLVSVEHQVFQLTSHGPWPSLLQSAWQVHCPGLHAYVN